MRTEGKMIASGALGACVAMLAVAAFFSYHHEKQPVVSHTTDRPNVIIQVGPGKPLYNQQQDMVSSTAEQLVQSSAKASYDTSGFVQYVYAQAGLKLPRTIADQSRVGTSIPSAEQLEKGDLVFFNLGDSGSQVSFVGIYLGNRQFAAVTTHGLMTISMEDPYWSGKFQFGRRVIV